MSTSLCPAGYVLLPDSKVTPAISSRAVALLQQWRSGNFPVGSTDSQETTSNLALDYRYEWHPPDFQNPVRHTGVTVYYCPGGGTQPAPLAPASAPPSPPAPSPSGSSGGASPSPPTSSDEAPGGADAADSATGAGGACVASDGSIVSFLSKVIQDVEAALKRI